MCAYHDDAVAVAANPTTAEAGDPEAEERYRERKRELIADGIQERLARLLRGRTQEAPKVMKVRVRGWGS